MIYFFSANPNNYKENKHRCIFSQWYMRDFIGNVGICNLDEYINIHDQNNFLIGKTFNCCEQWMMVCKTLVFSKDEKYRKNNLGIIKKIMVEKNPSNIKKFGRYVKGFDNIIWNNCKLKIVVNGNFNMFFQNEDMKKILLNTNKKILIEASPYDKIWGIGFSEQDAAKNKNKWGQNLLGKSLMIVRKYLQD